MDIATDTGAIEVNDVDSAAAELSRRREVQAEPASNESEVEAVEAEALDISDDNADIEATDDPEVENEEADEDAQVEEAAPSFETISELAEAVDMPIEDFLAQIKVTAKVDGKESQVTLADLQKGYQTEAHNTRNSMALAEQRKQFEQFQTEAKTQLQAEMQKAGSAFQMAQSQITSEFNSIDWNGLQQSDPQQYLLKRQQFGERQAQINQQIERATNQAQAYQNQQAEASEQAKQSYLEQQGEALNKAIPSWSDAKVRADESAQVTEYLGGLGFQAEEIGNITDHRIILLARQAMAAGKEVTSIDIAKKKVKTAPRLVKGNARQNVNSAHKKVAALTKRAKQTGSVDDIASALLARRN